MLKTAIDTWDLFDTLVARYHVTPESTFRILERETGIANFVALRVQAQRALDQIGKPYRLYAIYAELGRRLGITERSAQIQLAMREIGVELRQLIPIRRNVERIQREDLIVSDTYLPEDIVADIMRDVCGLHTHRPPIAGNWGKHTGTVWSAIREFYVIRKHHGDNAHSDLAVPERLGIATEHIADHQLNEWENFLIAQGVQPIALLVREVRLRCVPSEAGVLHQRVTGEYLTILLLFCVRLLQLAAKRGIEHYVFAARDAVHLSRVFREMSGGITSACVDLNRRLLSDAKNDRYFAQQLAERCAIVDMVASGRTVLNWLARIQRNTPFITLLYYDGMLDAQEKQQRATSGDFIAFAHWRDMADDFRGFEVLCNAGYPPVIALKPDDASGATIRAYALDDRSTEEKQRAEFVGLCVDTLAHAVRRRTPHEIALSEEQFNTILKTALNRLTALKLYDASPTFKLRGD